MKINRYLLLLVLTIAIAFSSCKKCETLPPSETFCETQNPLNDLSWLKNHVHAIKASDGKQWVKIYQGTYNGVNGFYTQYCEGGDGCGTSYSIFSTCAGETYCTWGDFTQCTPSFLRGATYSELILIADTL